MKNQQLIGWYIGNHAHCTERARHIDTIDGIDALDAIRRKFDGWRLTAPSGSFKMSRSAASFVVTGQDFPLRCRAARRRLWSPDRTSR